MTAVTKDAKYVYETNKFIMSYGYLKCKMCNEKEKYVEKTLADNTKGFKVTINQHIFDCETRVSTCKFSDDVFYCGIKNNCLQEPRFSLNVLRLNSLEKADEI